MLPSWYGEYKKLIDMTINHYLDNYFRQKLSKSLQDFKEVITYSLSGGKSIRAILALEFYLTLSKKNLDDLKISDDIFKYVIALEMMHAYSLIHDDLPSMDNDEYRRGNLTVWKKYGESQAILAGDLLNTLSFEVISDISDSVHAQMLTKLLASSSGFYGMLGGQLEDLYFEKHTEELDISVLRSLHSKKTGALIRASVLGGVILSDRLDNFEKYAQFSESIGLAFQIKDDLLDVEGNLEETGKSVGGEEKGYVYFLGLDQTKIELDKQISKSFDLIKDLNSIKLDFLVKYIGERKK